jgi:hypothetical protein
MRRLPFVVLVLFSAAATANAQNVAVDSLVEEGNRWIAAYRESQDLGDARRAHTAFTQALSKRKNHPAALLGLGVLHASIEGAALPINADVTGLTNHTLATRYLGDALKAGVREGRAYEALRTILIREFEHDRLRDVLKLAEMYKPEDDRGKAAIADLYIRAGKRELAIALLGSPATVDGRRMLGIALLGSSQTRDRGGAMYMEALAQADSAQFQQFILDARWLADTEESKLWSTLDWQQLQSRLTPFWQKRALTAAVSLPERLATHFARINHALDEFNFYRQRVAWFVADSVNRVSINTPPTLTSANAVSTGIHGRLYHVDDRAFIYVRYGEPDERIRTVASGLFNESWVYRRLADNTVSFDFFLPMNAGAMKLDARGWTLISSVMHCGATSELPYIEDYVRDRQKVDPRYTMILDHCSRRSISRADVDAMAMPFEKERRSFLANAMVRDHALPKTVKDVPIMVDVVQFKGSSPATTDVTAVVAWPLAPFTGDANGIHRIRLSFFVADTINGKTETRDTTINVRAPANSPNASVRVHVTVPAAAAQGSFYRVALRDLNHDSVNAVIGDSIDVKNFAVQPLTISDVAIAAPTDGGTWVRRDRKLSLLPKGAAVASFRLYYEIYGVAPQAEYTTSLTFIPQGDALQKLVARVRGSQTVTLKFNGRNETSEQTLVETRAMGTELPSGNYLMRISVTANGQTAATERMIRIP